MNHEADFKCNRKEDTVKTPGEILQLGIKDGGNQFEGSAEIAGEDKTTIVVSMTAPAPNPYFGRSVTFGRAS